jgi:hypothetical protein
MEQADGSLNNRAADGDARLATARYIRIATG